LCCLFHFIVFITQSSGFLLRAKRASEMANAKESAEGTEMVSNEHFVQYS